MYALGDPQRVDLDGKMLSAQAAAILSAVDQRVGTVIVLRDITEEVRHERAHRSCLISWNRICSSRWLTSPAWA
ncbi:MAG: hypothetical protein U0694_20275 [Anaerolineae bacterium]